VNLLRSARGGRADIVTGRPPGGSTNSMCTFSERVISVASPKLRRKNIQRHSMDGDAAWWAFCCNGRTGFIDRRHSKICAYSCLMELLVLVTRSFMVLTASRSIFDSTVSLANKIVTVKSNLCALCSPNHNNTGWL